MNDKPKDAGVSDDIDDANDGDRTIDTSVNLEDITVIDLEQIIENLEKENPQTDRATHHSRQKLEELLDKKREEEALKDLDDYDLEN